MFNTGDCTFLRILFEYKIHKGVLQTLHLRVSTSLAVAYLLECILWVKQSSQKKCTQINHQIQYWLVCLYETGL